MRRFAAFFMFIFFASIIAGPSMFMLSIEKGKVYTERFCINHILKTSYSSQPKNSQHMRPSLGAPLNFYHHHIQLTRYAIPEESFVPVREGIYSNADFMPTYHSLSGSLATISSPIQLDSGSRLELPIPPLLQSSLLLI
jgi:hypothetical protein